MTAERVYEGVDVDRLQHDDLGRRVEWKRDGKRSLYGTLVSADRARRVAAVRFEGDDLPHFVASLPNQTGFVEAAQLFYAGPKVLNLKMPPKK